MVLFVCFHEDSQEIDCQDCVGYAKNSFVWFITPVLMCDRHLGDNAAYSLY